MTELVILVPVLNRPGNVAPLLASIRETAPAARVLFLCDPDDVAEQDQIARAGGELLSPGGSYAAKINAGYHATTEPFFLTAADDLRFHDGWFERAMKYMVDGIGVVGTNDLCNPRVMCGQHATHSVVRRAYIARHSGVVDAPDTVLHEGYAHEYCDDEFVQTAMARGMYAHAFDSLVEHLHPLVGKADDDATYRLGRAGTRVSRRLYFTRRRLWMSR